ncbi:MAG TPA: ABC transporter ATP-binding protein [Allosphingosinicella sp.]|nr:ABC transporter ATP-binding protein [Allosphingosinicella sp.]
MSGSEEGLAESLPATLRAFARTLPERRRRQLGLVVAMMLAGALAEMITIGAVLPFIALLSDPGRAAQLPGHGLFLALAGAGGGGDLALRATLLFVAAVLLSAAARLAIQRLTHQFAYSLGHDVGTDIFARMLRQPYSLYISRNPSMILAGIDKVQVLIHQVVLPLLQGVTAAVMALAIIGVLTAIAPAAAAAAAAATLAYLAASYALAGRLRRESRTTAALASARMQAVQEGLGAIRDILLDHSQEVFEAHFRRLDRAYRRAQTAIGFAAAAPRFVLEAAGIALIALLALGMSRQPGGIAGALPVLGALALGAQRLLPLLNTAHFGWTQASGHRHAVGDLLLLLNAETVAARRIADPEPFRSEIRLDRVSLRRHGGEYSLREISLVIGKGERIGLAGRTGSGKSSLLDLLMGLLEPSAGEIRVDGRPLDEAARANWQAQIAHVPQSIYLADASIAANIAFAAAEGEIDMARVRAAAARAHVDAFIESLPNGYATNVGDRGSWLSGGQRQRIAIARAFYKRANVLILDEATGHLDRETEDAVIAAVAEAGRDITIVIVAHRESALAGCDRILRLEGGRLCDDAPARHAAGRV